MSDKFDDQLFAENEEILTFLEDSRLFGHLPKKMLQNLIPLSAINHLSPGQYILEEGQPNKKVYFLIRGTVAIYAGGELILKLRRTGDIFGEMSIISNKPCSASVVTDTPVSVFSINSQEVGEYSDLKPEQLQNILYRVFAKILTEKLSMTTHKAKQYEEANRNYQQTMKQLHEKIDEGKRAEEELNRMNEHLLKANADLQATQTQLIQSAKLASLGEMATGIAHELNQPMANIRLRTEILIEDWEEGVETNPVNKLKEILKMVDRGAAITNHLRTFGREAKLKRGDYSLNTILEDSILLVNEQLRLKSIGIHRALEDDLPLIHCNHILIEQAITNLLLNAQDAMSDASTKEVTLRSFREGDWVSCEIKDTGSGIPQDILEKIYDPFFTTKEVGEGTGLGLSITHSIIKDHGGRIEVKSEPEQGTIFLLRFPVVQSFPFPTEAL